MKAKFFILFSALFALFVNAKNNINYVNPFIGTGGHGHTFPNACLPFGNIQIGPVTDNKGWDWVSGYHYSDTTIMGFTHTRLSGTGIGDLSDILFMPRIGEFTTNFGTRQQPFPSVRSRFSHADEVATPGYYSVLLKDFNIKAEFTATEHCGLHRYTFPRNDSAYIIITPSIGVGNNNNAYSELRWVNDSTITGMRASFGWVPFRNVYFVATFSKPFYTHQMTSTKSPNFTRPREWFHNWTVGSVYFKTTHNEQITVKVGISPISVENAWLNLKTEVENKNFEQIKSKAASLWQKQLDKIKIEADEVTKEIFYTGLYHTMIHPNNVADVNGEYQNAVFKKQQSNIGKYYSTLSLWDTYRALHPLFSIINNKVNNDVVYSMIEHQKVNGYLPIWTLWGAENYCMIGNHSIPVIADAILKGQTGFDYEEAYRAMKESSIGSHKGSDRHVSDSLGYIPGDYIRAESVSKTLEMAYDDWCVAQVALKLGNKEDYDFFINRSLGYRKLFDKETVFFRAKDSKGNWMLPFNPYNIVHSHGYTEGNAWQYYWAAQHDIPWLVEATGGKKAFAAKLDQLFSDTTAFEGNWHDVTGLIGQYAHGNEPSHHVAYLYNYADQPRKTQNILARIMREMYRNQPDGLSGNEDCGQMSAWYIFTALGFYPVNPAAGFYDIGRPFVQNAVIKLENGKTFTVSTKNYNAKNIFVKSVWLNGKKINNHKIKHSDIINGGTLHFEMGK